MREFMKFSRGQEKGVKKPCQSAESKPLLNSISTHAPPQSASLGPEVGKKNKSTASYLKGKLKDKLCCLFVTSDAINSQIQQQACLDMVIHLPLSTS